MNRNTGKTYRHYSVREQRAYSAGRGYAACKAGKFIKCKTSGERRSFINGFKSARNYRRV